MVWDAYSCFCGESHIYRLNAEKKANMALSPKRDLWSSYDEEADVLYIHFDKSSRVTDSEITGDDIILRYDGERVVGITVLHASQR